MKIIVEVFPDDATSKLPTQIGLSIRSKAPIHFIQEGYFEKDFELGYCTKEYAQKAKKCSICGYPLTMNKTSEYQNLGEVHNRCVRCCRCGRKIEGNVKLKNRQLYCPYCLV